MGLLYGFELLFPVGQLRSGAEALSRQADGEGLSGCTLEFPGDVPLLVPFDGAGEDGPLQRLRVGQHEPATWLEGHLWFPVDEAVRGYLREPPRAERASIGNVSVFVYLGWRHAVLSVGAVTSSMSRLFEASAAVRQTMMTVLTEGGGHTAVFSREPGAPVDVLGRDGQAVRHLLLDSADLEDRDGVDAYCEGILGR